MSGLTVPEGCCSCFVLVCILMSCSLIDQTQQSWGKVISFFSADHKPKYLSYFHYGLNWSAQINTDLTQLTYSFQSQPVSVDLKWFVFNLLHIQVKNHSISQSIRLLLPINHLNVDILAFSMQNVNGFMFCKKYFGRHTIVIESFAPTLKLQKMHGCWPKWWCARCLIIKRVLSQSFPNFIWKLC